jgi:hypothetical protein
MTNAFGAVALPFSAPTSATYRGTALPVAGLDAPFAGTGAPVFGPGAPFQGTAAPVAGHGTWIPGADDTVGSAVRLRTRALVPDSVPGGPVV